MNITLPDYKKIAKQFYKDNQKNLEIPESKFEDAILWLRRSRAQYIALNRPAEMGDVLDVDFETKLGHIPLEGGGGKRHMFVLGKGKFVPGFEEHVQGMQIGDTRTFDIIVSESYWLTDLRNKTLSFSVTLHNIQKEILPEFSDDFAVSLGTFKNKAEVIKSIQEGLKGEQEDQEVRRLRTLLLQFLAEETKAEIEEEYLQKEAERILIEFKASLGPNASNFVNYLAQMNKTEEELKTELRPEAEKNIKIALLLGRIAAEEKIHVSDEEVETKTKEFLAQTKEEAPKEEDLPSFKSYVRNMLVAEKVLTLLEAQ